MPKRFCITGTCIPERNYMVDISGRVDRIVKEYIEHGQYFTINRARQYGKTTTLYLLERRLREEYLVLSLSFEAADEYFASLGSLAEGLVLDIGECLREQERSGIVRLRFCKFSIKSTLTPCPRVTRGDYCKGSKKRKENRK